jgi:hypothetical protein
VGFIVRTVLLDGEFEKVKAELPLLICNTTVAKEHMSKAEQSICTIKERTRGVVCALPFTNILQRLKIDFFILLPYG